MYAGAVTQSRVTMLFDYFRIGDGGEEELVAHGEQQTVCMRRSDTQLGAAMLAKALMAFRNG